MSCKNILKDTVPLEEGRELFSKKSSEGVLKPIVEQKNTTREELLRLQKTSFLEATSSSRGGIYYKCFLLIAKTYLKSCPSLRGTRTFFTKKVRRGFFTYRIAINRTTRGKPLRLQKTLFFESTSP